VLTDTHCHLDLDRFDPDRDAVIARAIAAGVERMLVPGTDMGSSRAAVSLAEEHPSLYAAIGIHPTEANSFQEESPNSLQNLSKEPKVVAIGEIGLDYYWQTAPHSLQKEVLQKQLDLATSLNLPVVIHFREKGDALDGPCARDLLEILEKWIHSLPSASSLREHPGVLHSFSGSLETAKTALGMGFFLGVTGPVTYRKDRQELVGSLPLESLLIETDAPFLSPQSHRGKRNEPAFVGLIADTIAMLHSLSSVQVAEVTGNNALKLFHW
jgi:TatD DNase family protein